MESNNKYSTLLQAGFTLVEVMVGLTIGMLATVIIMQVFSVFETQKRTTTGTSDAQTNGNIALYDIQRELEMAGYPLIPYGAPGVADSPLECASATLSTGATGIGGISPVTIIDGGAAGGSDTITIRYGDSLEAGIPVQITATPAPSTTLPSPAIDVPVTSNLGCNGNDNVLVINGSICSITSLAASGVPSAASGVNTLVTLADNSAVINGAAVTKANLSCLGKWNEVTYSVVAGNLVRTVVASGVTTSTPLVAGIVNLQAQYGISAAGLSSSLSNYNQVVQWVDATGTWAPGMTITDRNRIKAVHLAVVARNAKMEITPVTTACSTTAPKGPCSWDATAVSAPVASPAPAVDLYTTDQTWTQYRYRVFDTIIPLRNVMWSKGTL
ncbi:hypothetical protein GALL_215400 [mine drainage metagenome]|uniref:Type IV pilus assembly protein PilW n=1 Tax=mine drainage metagenome TaxID=410659 RepID=A0A1J5S434_9ZZZZ